MNEELILNIVMYILPVGFFIAGFFMLRFSLKLKKKLKQRKEDCSIATEGTVVKAIKKYVRTGDSPNRHMYFPVYEYTGNGEKITVKSEYGTHTPAAYQVGMQVELYYNPHNPTEIYVPADKADTVQIALFWGGLLFLFFVIFTLIAAIFLSTHDTLHYTF